MVSCEEKNTNSFDVSDLIGRWKFDRQLVNDQLQEITPDQYCKYDQIYEFHTDGTVTGNDPCQWNKFVESKANWKMENNKLYIDYYAIAGVSVNPVVISLTKNEMVLQQMYGDVNVVQNVFKKTTDADYDYAADAAGNYSGWMNYSIYYISDTFRGDSIPVEVSITKNNGGNISVEYHNIDVLGSIRTIRVDSIQTTRYWNERQFLLASDAGANKLFINPDSIYNIRSSGSLGTVDRDSLFFALNFSKLEFREPGNPNSSSVENFYQYQRFHGVKKK
jgi:hypothetical protein